MHLFGDLNLQTCHNYAHEHSMQGTCMVVWVCVGVFVCVLVRACVCDSMSIYVWVCLCGYVCLWIDTGSNVREVSKTFKFFCVIANVSVCVLFLDSNGNTGCICMSVYAYACLYMSVYVYVWFCTTVWLRICLHRHTHGDTHVSIQVAYLSTRHVYNVDGVYVLD